MNKKVSYTYQYLSRTETKIKECVRIIYNIIQSVTEKLSSLPYNRRHRIKATSFEELFEKTKALPWERYVPENGKFWVTKANSVKSKLFFC